MEHSKLGGTKPELPRDSSGKPTISTESGAKSGAPGETHDAVATESPDLVQLMTLWPKLSPTARAAIVALAGATAG